ncbi:MAG: hypothetical protein WAN11_23780 [Syntrophobacteraceae bacterium]
MYQANRNTFPNVDGVGIHPYHWPKHDIWDANYLSSEPMANWRSASPRLFAAEYFKRFDFLEQLAELMSQTDEEKSLGLYGKEIRITETGIPTKKLCSANESARKHPRLFIYGRNESVPEGVAAFIWEDKWEAFFSQVSKDYLLQNKVASLIYYSRRLK